MIRISQRLFVIGLAGLVFGCVLITPLNAIASETDGVSDVRIARLAKGINIPSWFWLNRGPVDELEKRYPDADFQLIVNLGFTHVRVPIDMANVYDSELSHFS
jgi:hypothetical protein